MSDTQWKMSDEELKRLQKKSLEITLYIRDFCQRNNIVHYLCGGGCIGAVRSGGFVPWDDDLDIMMPRYEYERFYKLWREQEKEEKYICLRTTDKLFTGNTFTTIVDKDTTCIKSNQAELDIPQGVVVDVFPIDGCPDGFFKRRMQMLHAMIFSLFITQVVPVNHGKLMSLGSKILLGIFRGDKIRYKIWRRAERKMTKYNLKEVNKATDLCAGPYYMRKEYPNTAFLDSVYKDFDGEKLPVPIGYHEYLTIAFGDYMTPPPVEQQVAHHDIAFCDTQNSYTKYRGIYYLTGKKNK